MDTTTIRFVILAVILVVTAVQSSPVQRCNNLCPRHFKPVCGRGESDTPLIFGNECQFQYIKCSSPLPWSSIEQTICDQAMQIIPSPPCNYKCPDTSAPICGITKDGKRTTFTNYCHFQSSQCSNPSDELSVLHSGVCKTSNNRKHFHCPSRCGAQKEPVCVEDISGNLELFDNLCLFRQFSCNNFKNTWEVVPLHTCVVQKTMEVRCKTECSDEEAPVCGINKNGKRTTFKNQCELENEACVNHHLNWKFSSNGACEVRRSTCPTFCKKIFRPVCGRDQSGQVRTFPNKCTFDANQCKDRASNWEFLREGDCEGPTFDELKTELTPECVGICNRDYDPICVMSSNGQLKTYLNKCEFETEKCTNRGGRYKIVKEEEC